MNNFNKNGEKANECIGDEQNERNGKMNRNIEERSNFKARHMIRDMIICITMAIVLILGVVMIKTNIDYAIRLRIMEQQTLSIIKTMDKETLYEYAYILNGGDVNYPPLRDDVIAKIKTLYPDVKIENTDKLAKEVYRKRTTLPYSIRTTGLEPLSKTDPALLYLFYSEYENYPKSR